MAEGKCEKKKCVICDNGCKAGCKMRGCVYEIICKECARRYRGQTGRSNHERTNEHVDGWKKRSQECPLFRHSQLYHEGRQFEFDVKILRQCFGKPSRRMISEAVYVNQLKEEETMNSRDKWTYMTLNKVNVHY